MDCSALCMEHGAFWIDVFPHPGCSVSATDYVWFTSDASVATVSSSGVVHSRGPGSAIITAAAALDPLNFAHVDVVVTLPSGLRPARHMAVEAELEGALPAAVSLENAAGTRSMRTRIGVYRMGWGSDVACWADRWGVPQLRCHWAVGGRAADHR